MLEHVKSQAKGVEVCECGGGGGGGGVSKPQHKLVTDYFKDMTLYE